MNRAFFCQQMVIESFSKNLIKGEDGIYRSKENSQISYPSEGNELCMQIEDSSFWFKHRNQVILSCAQRYFTSKEFCDIGGGNGFVSKAFQVAGYDTLLIEPGNEGAKNARKRGVENVICASLEETGLKPGSIANAGMFDVLEHIEDDLKFIEMLHQFLKPGGHLILTVPAYNWLWSLEDKSAGHFRRYTLSELKKKLKSQGFEPEFLSYIFSFLPPAILLARSLPYRLGIAKERKLEDHLNEHEDKGISKAIVDSFLRKELKKISNGKSINFGGSCLAVFKKV